MKLKKSTVYFLVFFLLLGLFLRLFYFHDLTFGYDQARDALESISIIKNHDIKIIGPTTDIRGLFHSPLFWYIISPFYYFSGGNPEIARIPMILINLVNIVFIYFFAKKLFKDEKIALLSSFLMTVSFEAVQYARWLSNPPPALLTIGIFFYGLWLVLEKKKIGLPLMVVSWGFSVAFQFFLVYQIIFILFGLIYLLVTSRKTLIESIKKYYWLYLATFIPLSFYILAQIKFKFIGFKSFLIFLSNHEKQTLSLWLRFVNFVNSIVKNIGNFTTVGNILAAKILTISLIFFVFFYVIRKNKFSKQVIFLFIWFISPLPIYFLEKNNSYFLNIGILYPLTLLIVFSLVALSEKLGKLRKGFLILFIGGAILTNIFLILNQNKKGEVLFSVQEKQILSDEKRIIDFLYKDKNNKDYGINSVTNPLLMNTTWAYVFDWYAKPKYGYLPHWLGYPLDDFGKEIKFNESKWNQKGKILYLIIEPTPGIPEHYIQAYKKYENTRSKIIEIKRIGSFTIEKRLLINNNGFSREELDKLL